MEWRFALASVLLALFIIGAGFNLRSMVRVERETGGDARLDGMCRSREN